MISIDTDTPSVHPLIAPSVAAIPAHHPSAIYGAIGNVARVSPMTKTAPAERGRGCHCARVSQAQAQPIAFGQVFLIQLAAAVESLWPLPGFGQSGGAVMLRIGMVMIRSGSQDRERIVRRCSC